MKDKGILGRLKMWPKETKWKRLDGGGVGMWILWKHGICSSYIIYLSGAVNFSSLYSVTQVIVAGDKWQNCIVLSHNDLHFRLIFLKLFFANRIFNYGKLCHQIYNNNKTEEYFKCFLIHKRFWLRSQGLGGLCNHAGVCLCLCLCVCVYVTASL